MMNGDLVVYSIYTMQQLIKHTKETLPRLSWPLSGLCFSFIVSSHYLLKRRQETVKQKKLLLPDMGERTMWKEF